MRRVLLILSLATACLAYCPNPDTTGFRNSEWQPNNVLIKMLNFFYDSIALTTADTCSPQKRFISLYVLAKTYFLSSNDTNYERAIADGRRKAEKQLKQTAAAIAGPFRGLVDSVLSVIDQPMNDVLVSCKPDTYQDDCRANLNDYRARFEKECKGYHNNVAVHSRLTRWANRQDAIDHTEDLVHASNTMRGDNAVLDYFQKTSAVKYKDALKELQGIVQQVKHGIFNCNALSFVNIHCL
ncbi:PREDICTED: uncharacterized protein LOC106106767 [Papilio polytes]|uniref:uncharacterized protein LOC106106767 n=1 Tax=Papilio polytes TaxID=76194 RepID=UPI000675DC80|nr:PREDICTED: uncharacterized protein LOC106106767 [Papilio polytes]XP_013142875.1 PREDICTED: uncharacterized protein LOC106106767 [Papilio polytes]XP_013142876.1 PREDICTED: uncharacterized protein LOC106106767 [Papilio polytes]